MRRFLLGFLLFSVTFHPVIAQKILAADEINLLVPLNLDGFDRTGRKSKVMQIGTLRYSFCEASFRAYGQSVRAILFDYNEAPIMYHQAARSWSNYSTTMTDSIIVQPVATDSGTGWETERKGTKIASVQIGIRNRFLLVLNSEGGSLETLRTLLGKFEWQKFPK